MKRKTVAVLALCLMGAAFMTGCGESPAAQVDASKNEDLSAKVTEQNKVEDSKDAYNKFLDAQKAMEATDSLTINTELIVKISPDGNNESNSQRFDIKRMLDGDKRVVDFTMSSEAKALNEDGSVDEENSNKRELPGYFYDGMLYYVQDLSDTEGDNAKLKEEISYEDLMSIVGSTYILNDITADQIESTALESKNGGTQYIYILDKDAISKYMIDNLSASGVPFEDNGGVDINYANISADINKDGILTAYTFSVDAVIKEQSGEVPFSYNIASAFSNINSTKVDVKSEEELSEYMTTDEYSEKLQQEQEELAEMPIEEASAENGAADTTASAEDIGLELTEDQSADIKIGE